MSAFPPCPQSLKTIQHFLKAAVEHDKRDPIVSYWCRLHALEVGMKIDRSSDEAKKLLGSLMVYLEKFKAENRSNEAVTNEVVAQAHIENYAFKIFTWADNQDRAAVFNKNVVKAFYTANVLFDVLTTFGELNDEFANQQKYAKFKAAYIHNCLKDGITPQPGPMGGDDENMLDDEGSMPVPPPDAPPSAGFNVNVQPVPAPRTSPAPVRLPAITPEVPSDSGSGGSGSGGMSADENTQAQKLCKWAVSALSYNDYPSAIDNLTKALDMIKTKNNL